MMKISQTLSDLMKERGVNGVQLAKLLNLSSSCINNFLLEKRTPCFKTFLKILDFFNCSADYLLGREDIPREESFCEVIPFHIRLRQLLKDYGVSQEKLKRDLKISGSLIYKWLKGISEPYTHSLILLADYFDCSVDFLIGRVR